MTPRTFFKIVIKIFALYTIFKLVCQVPMFFSLVFEIIFSGIQSVILPIVFYLIVAIIVVYFMLFKTDKIIDWFQLDKGFEEEKFEFNLHRSSILRIVLIVFGIVLIALALPDLLIKVYSFLQMRQIDLGNLDSANRLIIDIFQIVIAIIIVFYNKNIVNFIELQRKK